MEKLNIAEILKDCPKGMELDCTMWDSVQLKAVTIGNIYPIKIQTPEGIISLTKNGCYSINPHCKCVIFPKGKTTWEGFQRPFKDGDVVATTNGLWIGITTGGTNNECIPTYCVLEGVKFEAYLEKKEKWRFNRLATEEEKQELFDAIKANGYKWNAKTKTLEKLIEPKFKVGDKIVKRNSISNSWIVSSVSSEYYGLKLPNGSEGIGVLHISEQDDYDLVPNKFDITTLNPFDRVLVRQSDTEHWKPAFWGRRITNKNFPFITSFGSIAQAIPFKGNEWLVGTTNDCDEYFKTWK